MVFRNFFGILVTIILFIVVSASFSFVSMDKASLLLTDPFLQLPTEDSIRVVWFTEFPGENHRVLYGNHLASEAPAVTTKLKRMREDKSSKIDPSPAKTINRNIWRHESLVTGLIAGKRVPYQVISDRLINGKHEEIRSKQYTLSPQPQPGTASKILLTSDHQLMPMVCRKSGESSRNNWSG